jgi:hypothetical protein
MTTTVPTLGKDTSGFVGPSNHRKKSRKWSDSLTPPPSGFEGCAAEDSTPDSGATYADDEDVTSRGLDDACASSDVRSDHVPRPFNPPTTRAYS